MLRKLNLHILDRMSETYSYYNRSLSDATDIPMPILKPMLRELRLHGLVQYNYGNLNEDGELYGSGHSLTELGREYLLRMRKMDDYKYT